ncbi:hypothetical protein [Protaetiibacter larvae]|uniref:DUF1425 domain-containing protein n=1 Tax=Protaetiibacter larvae TaxID=2592654 RepID=A0A5C1Y816_9MICO|nr:hypothetical protein [Protaetiibacter larvae]QEO09365.1 hypothetical protein FLP23_04650 [Protaetiibacter larvae]
MRARAVAAIALSGALAIGLSGCNFVMEPETNQPYDPSDGVSLDLGDLALRNVLIVTEDGETGELLGTAVNTTDAAIPFTIQWRSGGEYHEVKLRAAAGGSTDFGWGDGDTVEFENLDTPAGGLLDAVVHIADDQAALQIPVLDASFPGYDEN